MAQISPVYGRDSYRVTWWRANNLTFFSRLVALNAYREVSRNEASFTAFDLYLNSVETELGWRATNHPRGRGSYQQQRLTYRKITPMQWDHPPVGWTPEHPTWPPSLNLRLIDLKREINRLDLVLEKQALVTITGWPLPELVIDQSWKQRSRYLLWLRDELRDRTERMGWYNEWSPTQQELDRATMKALRKQIAERDSP